MTDASNFRLPKGPDDLVTPDQLRDISGREFIDGIMEGRYGAAPIAVTLGFEITAVGDGEVTFRGTPGFHCFNPMGAVHGGWFGAIMDSCMACAIQTRLPKGSGYTTQEYKLNLLRPVLADTEPLLAKGRARHVGRRTAAAEGELVGEETGKLYAIGSTTCLILPL